MPSVTSQNTDVGFDQDVQQLLGADFVPPKELVEMTANDIADRVAAEPVRYIRIIARTVLSDSFVSVSVASRPC